MVGGMLREEAGMSVGMRIIILEASSLVKDLVARIF